MKHVVVSGMLFAALVACGASGAQAQVVISGGQTTVRPSVSTPPSVDGGLANGNVKAAGAPSVSNGVANGIVKQAGSPSVGNGVANGSAKSTTIQQ